MTATMTLKRVTIHTRIPKGPLVSEVYEADFADMLHSGALLQLRGARRMTDEENKDAPSWFPIIYIPLGPGMVVVMGEPEYSPNNAHAQRHAKGGGF